MAISLELGRMRPFPRVETPQFLKEARANLHQIISKRGSVEQAVDPVARGLANFLELPKESPRRKVIALKSTERRPFVLSAEQLDHQTSEIVHFLQSHDGKVSDVTAKPDGSVQKTAIAA